ncbi:MAG: class I SAM-dependent methyltransferase [Armatimonadetes bacterium]|nr:class I SAM-dependent methyltransferase [Armatimonadota bacterium]
MDQYTRRPDLYDLEHAGDTLPGEIEFYVNLARAAGGPVLELAVGTGRVGLEVARAGVELVGLDLSEPMLSAARHKAEAQGLSVTLLHEDMRTFDLGRKFNLIYVPFRAFLHLHTQEDQRACLRRVAAHLAPSGRFAGNFFKPKPSLLEGNAHERYEQIKLLEDGSLLVRSYCAPNADIHEQLKEIHLLTRIYDPHGDMRSSRIDPLRLTWIHGREWRLLLELEGFALERLDGGFNGESAGDGWEYVWVARRAS